MYCVTYSIPKTAANVAQVDELGLLTIYRNDYPPSLLLQEETQNIPGYEYVT